MLYNDQSVFFYGSCLHLDLHSFPTRRSSDLSIRQNGAISPNPAKSGSTKRSTVPFRQRQSATGWLSYPTLMAFCTASMSDRKSTRLNSSHRCISYAVFCLKKKNHNEV